MRTTLFLLVSTLVLISFTLTGASSSEMVNHHGQLIELGEDSSDCIVCHDGTVTSNAAFCTRNCNHGTAHSVAKEYPPRGREDSYAPVDSLRQKGIRLNNGQTTCLSCHNLNNQAKYHLVIDNSGSALCFACHVKL